MRRSMARVTGLKSWLRFSKSIVGRSTGMTAKFKHILAALILFLGVAEIGRTQGPTAAINGQVTDASGAAIPGATVTAKDIDRGTNWPTQTNAEGYFTLPRLPIGNYD